MLKRILLPVLMVSGLLAARPAAAQSSAFGFEFRSVAKVVQGTDTLRNAWAGGLDSPQFSSIDLNGDNQADLFVFDRRTRRVLTYLNAAAPSGGREWQYAPDYAALFPGDLLNWALLRDYDCDGRPDLFTSGPNSVDIRVLRNVAGAGGRPTFQLVSSRLEFVSGANTININTGSEMPSIADVDGDGRLDIVLTDWNNNKYFRYCRNVSPAACGGLQFREETPYWGNIQSCLSACGSYDFTGALCRPSGTQHTYGHNLTLLDLDGDGDKDALVGRDYCSELTALINQGTPLLATMTNSSLNNNFPSSTTPARVPYFPAAYHLDVNFDGKLDLLVAPNLYDNLDTVETRRSVLFYENTSALPAPNFQFRQPDFLQKDMIEASSLAAPAFLDVDADGLLDMLVVGVRRDAPGNFLVASVTHYRNVGTATRPVYKLITTDYLNLSAKKFGALKLMPVDLNRDGALELACIGFRAMGRISFLGYYPNRAAAGQAPNFDTSALRLITNVPGSQYDNATFFDVDNDGFVDLLYATNSNRTDLPGQALRYYRNNGTSPVETAFVVANSDFGQIRNAAGVKPTNLYPVVADFDGDTKPDLLTVDASGVVRMFGDFRAQTGIFIDRTSLLYNNLLARYDDGQLGVRESNHFTLATADLNGDSAPELLLGTESGGVLALATRNRVLGIRAAAQAVPLTLYPNPAAGKATLEAAQPVRVTLLDLTGRIVRAEATAARRHELSLSGLAAGVYVVRCETADGQLGVQRLVVK